MAKLNFDKVKENAATIPDNFVYHDYSDDQKKEIKQSILDNTPNPRKTDAISNVIERSNQKSNALIAPMALNVNIRLGELVEAPTNWNFFPMPDIDTIKIMATSMYHQGQLAPAIVWCQPDGNYMILGGHTRFRVLQFLRAEFPDEAERFSTMKCHVYGLDQINDEIAQYIIILNNMTQRAKEAPSRQVKSIVRAMDLQKKILINGKKIGERNDRSNEQLANIFGISSSTVDRLYKLRKLIPEFAEMLDNGDIAKGLALNLAAMKTDVQEALLISGAYTKKLHPDTIRKLIVADNMNMVENILNAPVEYKYGNVLLEYEIPKNFKKLNLALDEEDATMVKRVFLDSIKDLTFKNEMTKTVLMDLLSK